MTADLDGFVAVVDIRRRRIVRRLPTVDGPRSVEARAGASAIVAHASEGAVTLLDGPPMRVRRVLRGSASRAMRRSRRTGCMRS